LQGPTTPRQPERFDKTDRFCCDAGDTVKTKFRVEPGGGPYPEDRWYAWLDERWMPIPPDKVVPDYAPDGRAYLLMMDFGSDEGGYKTIVCFVRPKGGL
jgi:hypothetical protein